MQGKHVLMSPGKDLVTCLDDQSMDLIIESPTSVVCIGSAFLKDGISRDHLARDQILPYGKVLERPLRLGSPEPIGWHIHLAQTISLLAHLNHDQSFSHASRRSIEFHVANYS
ncbi:hypothetical protein X768_27965 [Mesorhizobium sp. LSJC265A00]|nr:hypothetical protein X768_27965 [Mesorhizobium sp. LSJC265A00]